MSQKAAGRLANKGFCQYSFLVKERKVDRSKVPVNAMLTYVCDNFFLYG